MAISDSVPVTTTIEKAAKLNKRLVVLKGLRLPKPRRLRVRCHQDDEGDAFGWMIVRPQSKPKSPLGVPSRFAVDKWSHYSGFSRNYSTERVAKYNRQSILRGWSTWAVVTYSHEQCVAEQFIEQLNKRLETNGHRDFRLFLHRWESDSGKFAVSGCVDGGVKTDDYANAPLAVIAECRKELDRAEKLLKGKQKALRVVAC